MRSRKWAVRDLSAWLHRHRIVAVVAAFWIVFVPTAWTVIPGWSRWSGGWRALVLMVWGIAAALLAIATHRQSEQMDDLMGEAREVRRLSQEAAGLKGISLLLRHRSAGFEPYDLELFVIDDETGELYSAASSSGLPTDKRWEPGRGATGYAYYTGERVIVRGQAVADGTYGLSKEDQTRYQEKGTAIVAAMPVTNASGRPIGVLTADGSHDTGYLETDQGFQEQLQLVGALARFMIDLCGWETDGSGPRLTGASR